MNVTLRRAMTAIALIVAAAFSPVSAAAKGNYADVDGLRMYYEISGHGGPLVLIHGGGSTIDSTYGHVLQVFARTHRVIAVELQAHGRTLDMDRPLSFEQDADDVAALMSQLKISSADIMGFSNGGTTALQIAIRHPKVVRKLILLSTLAKRDGMPPGFFDGFRGASLEKSMPPCLKEAYLKVNPSKKGLQEMFDRDVARMSGFKDIPDEELKAIQAPVLIVNGDQDLVRPEHALELFRTLPHARLAILPGGHGEYIGEICSPKHSAEFLSRTVGLVDDFLLR